MNKRIISSEKSWYTDPVTKTRQAASFVSKSIDHFYHSDYKARNEALRTKIGTVENIITTLKNNFDSKNIHSLQQAANSLMTILRTDLPVILKETSLSALTICITPRAKALSKYSENQLFFKKSVTCVARDLNGFMDGTDYILRHKDTCTTHLNKSGHGGEGDLPHPGITKNTCRISEEVKAKDILLIDDLYTLNVNIVEDAIQALLDHGAASVVFYSLGKTL